MRSRSSSPSMVLPILITIVSLLGIYVIAIYVVGLPMQSWPDTPVTESGMISQNPAVCAREYVPVCGNDKKTYANACLAENAGVSVVFSGACDTKSTSESDTDDENRDTHTGSRMYTGTTAPVSSGTIASGSSDALTHTGMQNHLDATGSTNNHHDPSDSDVMSQTATGETQPRSFENYGTGSYHQYTNEYLKYSFAMPNYSYYQGQGAQNGANHTMAIATTATGIEVFETAPIQVYFYKTLPADAPSTLSATTPNGTVYVKTYGDLSEKEQRIVQTILESAH